jgi:hypothetical protein
MRYRSNKHITSQVQFHFRHILELESIRFGSNVDILVRNGSEVMHLPPARHYDDYQYEILCQGGNRGKVLTLAA